MISAETQVIRYVTNSKAGHLKSLFVSRLYNALGLLSNEWVLPQKQGVSKAKPCFRFHGLALLLNLGGTAIAFKVKDLDSIPVPSPSGQHPLPCYTSSVEGVMLYYI